MMWEVKDRTPGIRFLIRDNDRKVTEAFDTVFRSEGLDVIRTPYRVPNANASAERWIRCVREACLDKLLHRRSCLHLINQAHLRRVMREDTRSSTPHVHTKDSNSRFPCRRSATKTLDLCVLARCWAHHP